MLPVGTVVQPFLLVFLLAILYYPTVAQYSWSEINVGLYGASIRGFATADGGRFLAATNGGVYVRPPGGASWQRSIGGDDASTLCPLPGGVVVAGFGPSILRTSDAGSTWETVHTGLYVRSFGRLRDGVVMAAGSPWGTTVQETIVRRSTDNGVTWSNADIAPQLNGDVVFAIGSDGRCFAGTAAGIFFSNDDGATWNAASFSNPVNDLIVMDGAVVAATHDGIFLTRDNGLSWGVVDTLPAQILRYDSGMVYGVVGAGNGSGLYRTSALGSAWERLTAVVPRAVDISADGDLWIAVGTTPLRSPDGGNAWFDGSVGLTCADVSDVVAVGDVAVASVRGALYRFLPIDGRWELLQHAPQLNTVSSGNTRRDGLVSMLGVSRERSIDSSFAYDEVLYCSDDYGETWSARGRGGHMTLPVCEGSSFGVIGHARITGSAISGGGVLVTRNGGSTWESTTLDAAVSAVAISDGNLFAAAIGMSGRHPIDLGLYRSSDSGRTWDTLIADVAFHELKTLDGGRILAIASRPELEDGDTILGRSMLAIIDGNTVHQVLVDTIPIAIHVALEHVILIDAVLPDARTVTLRSSDYGASWHTILVGDNEHGRLASVNGTIGGGLMGIADGSPHGSTDGGATWSSMGSGLPRRNASSIAHRQSRSFVVGTSGDGVFSFADLMEAPAAGPTTRHRPISLSVVGDQLRISTDHSTEIALDVTDVRGHSLLTLLNHLTIDGRMQLQLNDLALPMGVYLIRARGICGTTTIAVTAGR